MARLLNDYGHKRYLLGWVLIGCLLCILITLSINKTKIVYKFLQRLEENWKSILDNFQEGIILFNKEFKILYKNNSIKTIFGYESNDESNLEENISTDS